MSGATTIEWTSSSWNPIRGTKGRHICQRISPGCTNCYAAAMNMRFRGPDYVAGADEPRLDLHALQLPLRWRKGRKVFVCSMTDLFWERLPDEWIDHVFAVMAIARDHTFQVLTKRASRLPGYVRGARERVMALGRDKAEEQRRRGVSGKHWPANDPNGVWPLSNVHLGVSVEDQAAADERIPLLLQTPAAVRWVSYEPALGPVDFRRWTLAEHGRRHIGAPVGLGWVVIGGESGPGAREFSVAWARSTVDQCRGAGVPAFVKQIGRAPYEPYGTSRGWPVGVRVDHASGCPAGPRYWIRLKDRKGGDMAEWPEDLRVREFPA